MWVQVPQDKSLLRFCFLFYGVPSSSGRAGDCDSSGSGFEPQETPALCTQEESLRVYVCGAGTRKVGDSIANLLNG